MSVVDPSILDRETTKYLVLQVVASDSAPIGSRKSTTVPVNITIVDENDSQPLFVQVCHAKFKCKESKTYYIPK